MVPQHIADRVGDDPEAFFLKAEFGFGAGYLLRALEPQQGGVNKVCHPFEQARLTRHKSAMLADRIKADEADQVTFMHHRDDQHGFDPLPREKFALERALVGQGHHIGNVDRLTAEQRIDPEIEQADRKVLEKVDLRFNVVSTPFVGVVDDIAGRKFEDVDPVNLGKGTKLGDRLADDGADFLGWAMDQIARQLGNQILHLHEMAIMRNEFFVRQAFRFLRAIHALSLFLLDAIAFLARECSFL